MSKPNLYFLAASEPDSGLGHLTRSLNLAKRCSNFSKARFVVPSSNLKAVKIVREFGCPAEVVISDYETALDWQPPVGSVGTILDVCDRYWLSKPTSIQSLVTRCKMSGNKVILIDGLYSDRLPQKYNGTPDMLIQPYFGAENDSPYESGIWLAGGEFVILGEEYQFADERKHTAKMKLLISLGGSDPFGLSQKILSVVLLNPMQLISNITIVVGPGFTDNNVSQIEHLSEGEDAIEIRYKPSSLAELFRAHDIAIVGSGASSRYEAIVSGCIPLVVGINPTHDRQCREDAVAGLGRYMGLAQNLQDTHLMSSLSDLTADRLLRSELVENARHKISTSGAQNIANEIERLLNVKKN